MSKRSIIVLALIALLVLTAALAGPVVAREVQFAPSSPLSCDQQERVWLDAIPAIAFDNEGQLVVAYDVKNVTRCYYDPAHPNDPIQDRAAVVGGAWSFFARF
jgi:hypothetical protein